jgi:hypothetical protein
LRGKGGKLFNFNSFSKEGEKGRRRGKIQYSLKERGGRGKERKGRSEKEKGGGEGERGEEMGDSTREE